MAPLAFRKTAHGGGCAAVWTAESISSNSLDRDAILADDELMVDEPENLTLILLREIRAEQVAMREDIAGMRGDMTEVRVEQHALAGLLGKVTDAVTEVAKVQEQHSVLLREIVETQRSHGGRLNTIDGRLAILERRAGLVEA
jgi:hypothetical protein